MTENLNNDKESSLEENSKNMDNSEQKDERKRWQEETADRILQNFPEQEVYTFAAGISPSGTVHFGNFRDVMTSIPIIEELEQRGKKTRFLFSWDDYDRFRKVPAGIPASFDQYIGMPLTEVPDPTGETESYAKHFQKEFEEAVKALDINMEYHYQTKEYKSGKYNELILEAIEKRKDIGEILLSLMSDKGKEEKGIDPKEYIEKYYPITVYSRFSGKDNTTVLKCDGYNITYRCNDTKKEETIDFRETGNVKLQWKVDWPMRWKAEGVVFEPGGHDHASPGGSFDASSRIARKVFNIEPPVFVGYEFIGLRGLDGKMSGSSGLAISPAELLNIYEPDILKWLYLRKTPHQSFQLAFDTEIFRQYDEYDRDFPKEPPAIPFRQAVAFGETLRWDREEVFSFLERINLKYDESSITERLNKARYWLEKYNPEEMIKIRESINSEYLTKMSEESKDMIDQLRKYIISNETLNLEDITALLYDIPKKGEIEVTPIIKKRQKLFFEDIYNLLISSDKGPRLATFLCALDRQRILDLLNINEL